MKMESRTHWFPRRHLPGILAGLLCLYPALAPGEQPALDGPNVKFKDDLFDKLAGTWKITGTVMGQKASQTAEAEWVLGHQFMRLHMKELPPKTKTPEGEPPYEAMVFIGYDNTSERYVAHWIDTFGARFSETLGYGTRSGDAVKFVFEYPDGPFHTSFTFDPASKGWRVLMRTQDKSGNWMDFADMTWSRKGK